MSVLKIKDSSGNWQDILTIKGSDGKDGIDGIDGLVTGVSDTSTLSLNVNDGILTGDINKTHVIESDYYYHKSGNVVQVNLQISRTFTLNGWGTYTVGTLPVGFRPNVDSYIPLCGYCTGEKGAFLKIATNGVMSIINWKSEAINQPNCFANAIFII